MLVAKRTSLSASTIDPPFGARRPHQRSLGKIGLIGIGAAVALGVAGFLAAPLVGAAIGGLRDSLGQRQLLMASPSLVAVPWRLGVRAWPEGCGLCRSRGDRRTSRSGGGTALYELGSATARGELVKLQITFKLGLLDASKDMAKAQQAIANLVAQADTTRIVLDEERSSTTRTPNGSRTSNPH